MSPNDQPDESRHTTCGLITVVNVIRFVDFVMTAARTSGLRFSRHATTEGSPPHVTTRLCVNRDAAADAASSSEAAADADQPADVAAD